MPARGPLPTENSWKVPLGRDLSNLVGRGFSKPERAIGACRDPGGAASGCGDRKLLQQCGAVGAAAGSWRLEGCTPNLAWDGSSQEQEQQTED